MSPTSSDAETTTDQGRVRLERPHGVDALEARPARHAQIHQDKVVASPIAALINQPVEGPHLTKGQALLERLQQVPQSGTEQLVVITDQYFHRCTLDLECRRIWNVGASSIQ